MELAGTAAAAARGGPERGAGQETRLPFHAGGRTLRLAASQALGRHLPADGDRMPRPSACIAPGIRRQHRFPFAQRQPSDPLGIHVAQRDTDGTGLGDLACGGAPERELERVPPLQSQPEPGLVQRAGQVLNHGAERPVRIAGRHREGDEVPQPLDLHARRKLAAEVRFEVVEEDFDQGFGGVVRNARSGDRRKAAEGADLLGALPELVQGRAEGHAPHASTARRGGSSGRPSGLPRPVP